MKFDTRTFLLWVALLLSSATAFLQRPTPTSTPQRADAFPPSSLQATTKVVVIGGGWAGFSFVDAVSSIGDDIQVELLDASPRGAGGLAGGWRTPKLDRPVEAGLHGFWREYRNTFNAIESIDGVEVDEILTPFTPSILVSETGRVATAPVLGSIQDAEKGNATMPFSNLDFSDPTKLMESLADLLPPPLDVALLAEYSPDSPLTLGDRLSAIGLLGAWADFGQEDKASWNRYDKMSAETLFCVKAGVSPTLYRELVTPLLHVLPMTPGYDCSAAAALSCFHVFALQSRGAFDVRWCRGTISEKIFNPWAAHLQARGNVKIRGSSKVTSLSSNSTTGGGTTYKVVVNDDETLECDAVVFAVGGTSLKRLLASCPPLQNFAVSRNFEKLRGVTCVAVRLFLKPDPVTSAGLNGGMYDSSQLPPRVARAMQESPVVVCGPRVGGIPELAETGFCIYDLQRLHDEFAVINQGVDDDKEACAAIEVDFFRADVIANFANDDDVAALALRAVAAALDVEDIDPSSVLDISVVRARDAVSHFCVDSVSASPDVRLEKGIYMAGDWIDRTGHASWSTEKAVVTGRQAADAFARDFGLKADIEIIPAAQDTPQLGALRQAARAARRMLSPLGEDMIPLAPWVLARQLTRGRL